MPPILHFVGHTEHASKQKNMPDTMQAECIKMRVPLEGDASLALRIGFRAAVS
jgi:hypothetical protein